MIINPRRPTYPPGTNHNDNDGINPIILRQLSDALFSNGDGALALQIFSSQPLALQAKYIEKLDEIWERNHAKKYRKKGVEDDSSYLCISNIYHFFNTISQSLKYPLDYKARVRAEDFLSKEEFAYLREPNDYLYIEPQEAGFRTSDPRIGRTILKISSDKKFNKVLETALTDEDLTQLFQHIENNEISAYEYIPAAIIFLTQKNERAKANKLLDLTITYANSKDSLLEVKNGIWVRPHAYFAHNVIEKILGYCFSSYDGESIRENLYLSGSVMVDKALKLRERNQHYSLTKTPQTVFRRSLRAVCIEEEFNAFNISLTGYQLFPPNWIYTLRLDSRRYTSDRFTNFLSGSINKRMPEMDTKDRGKINSILAQDIALGKAA